MLYVHSLLYGEQASDSLFLCNEQELRKAGAAIMAKRRIKLLGYSLLTMQSYAAKQASKKQQLCRAHHLHRLHVHLEAFVAWRFFIQVRYPFVWWLAADLQSVIGIRVQTCNLS